MSRKLPSCMAVQGWISDIPELKFNGTRLHCTICDTDLSWNVKTRVLQHIATEKHKKIKNGEVCDSERQKQFNLDLAKVMVECSIPWSKLDNPDFKQFFQSNVRYGNVTIPVGSTLRKNYLSQVYEEIRDNITRELHDKNIWVSIEISNTKGQIIADILVGGMDESGPTKAHLISSNILESISAETVTECVTTSLKKLWGKNFQYNKKRLLLFITDSDPNMIASGQCLRGIYVNLVHLTCLACGLHQVAETIRSCFPNVDKLMCSVMKVFQKSQHRNKRVLSKSFPNIPEPPQIIETRGGTWLEAVSYYYRNFNKIKEIIGHLDPSDSSISQVVQEFANPILLENLAYIHHRFSKISLVICKLQHVMDPEYSIIDALNVVFDLRHFIFQLQGKIAKHAKNKFEAILQDNPGFYTICGIIDLFTGAELNYTSLSINVQSLSHFKYYKYAPVTCIDVERTLLARKWVVSDRRQRLTSEHMEQVRLVYFNASAPCK